MATVAALLVATALGPVPSQAQDRSRQIDCGQTSVGLVPLTDLGPGTYQGATGGLYPLGTNTMPPAHLALGLAAAARVVPRNAAGDPDPAGSVVFASVGFSNAEREFAEFLRLLPATSTIDDQVVVVNAAQGGEHILTWADPAGRPWRGLEAALAQAGVTAQQVQVLWVKMTQRVGPSPLQPFPESALTFRDQLIQVIHLLAERLPNVGIAYLSSRTYGGYNTTSSPSPEPLAYEEGFGVKWVVEQQIAGEGALNADPAAGVVLAPWLAWGPYLWADGTTARSDGLTWRCDEYSADGVHLQGEGNAKVAAALMEFLREEPTAAWMFTDRELPPPPTDLGEPIPTSTIAGAAPPSATTTTTTPVTTSPQDGEGDDKTGDGAGAPAEADGGGPPTAVWVAVGAGGALLLIAVAVTASRVRRRRRSE